MGWWQLVEGTGEVFLPIPLSLVELDNLTDPQGRLVNGGEYNQFVMGSISFLFKQNPHVQRISRTWSSSNDYSC